MTQIDCKRVDYELILRAFNNTIEGSYCCVASSVDIGIPGSLEKVKQDLDNGIWPDHCRICEKDEHTGIQSWRQLGNDIYKNNKQIGIELYLENTCDLACIYCSRKYSSVWESEIDNALPADKEMLTELVNDSGFIASRKIDFTTRILEHVADRAAITSTENSFHIILLGGEPLLVKYFKKNIIEDIVDAFFSKTSDNRKLFIKIVTNGNTPDTIVDKNIEIIRRLRRKFINLHIVMDMSIDSAGKNAELVRYGLDYNQWLKNFKKYLKNGIQAGCRVSFNTVSFKDTTTIMNAVFDIVETVGLKTYFAFNPVRYPKYLSIGMLPEYDKHVIDDIKTLIYKRQHLIDNVAWPTITKYMHNVEPFLDNAKELVGTITGEKQVNLAKDALRFFEYIKRVRNKDLKTVHPDLYYYYKSLTKRTINETP